MLNTFFLPTPRIDTELTGTGLAIHSVGRSDGSGAGDSDGAKPLTAEAGGESFEDLARVELEVTVVVGCGWCYLELTPRPLRFLRRSIPQAAS